jgi:hypothetical protein
MTVPPDALAHKTLMIALLACADDVARELGLSKGVSATAMARALGTNRTAMYEQKGRLLRALGTLAATGPGRPPAATTLPDGDRCQALELTVRVQAFRLEHLDAVIVHGTRTSYSPSFRRWILGELDRWPGSRAVFASATGLPPDTLTDWVRDDRAGLKLETTTTNALPPERTPVPVEASETARTILDSFKVWEGPTKHFLRLTAARHGLVPDQVARVLRICGALAPRPRRPFRHRRSTELLTPGALVITDGKSVDVELTDSHQRMRLHWQGIVDQATGCDTAVVVSDEEDAAAVRQAFERTVSFLGGAVPAGLLHDNKPCYLDDQLCAALQAAGTLMVSATLRRPENKALLEGAFSLFEARVGTIRLDDRSQRSLIHSAVREVIRAYTAATNGVPRAELGGRSRERALRSACPSAAQQAADQAFVRRLKARHDRYRTSNWRQRIKPMSRRLLGLVFRRLGLAVRDPKGRLQEYLAIYEPAAIRQAEAIVSLRLKEGALELAHAHRYFAKVVQNVQASLDLERQADELLELCQLQCQDWVALEREDYETLQRDCLPEELVCAVAERAVSGSLPVAAAFWTTELLALLRNARHLLEPVRRFLIRLYEAPPDRRLLLLDRLAALQLGLV